MLIKSNVAEIKKYFIIIRLGSLFIDVKTKKNVNKILFYFYLDKIFY